MAQDPKLLGTSGVHWHTHTQSSRSSHPVVHTPPLTIISSLALPGLLILDKHLQQLEHQRILLKPRGVEEKLGRGWADVQLYHKATAVSRQAAARQKSPLQRYIILRL